MKKGFAQFPEGWCVDNFFFLHIRRTALVCLLGPDLPLDNEIIFPKMEKW
jgi:hypothetical protein